MEIGETTLEKSVTKFFTPFNIVASLGQRSPIWLVGYTNTPLATYKISSCSDDLSPRYLLPTFVDFVAGVTHKNTKKHTVNDMSPHYIRRQLQIRVI